MRIADSSRQLLAAFFALILIISTIGVAMGTPATQNQERSPSTKLENSEILANTHQSQHPDTDDWLSQQKMVVSDDISGNYTVSSLGFSTNVSRQVPGGLTEEERRTIKRYVGPGQTGMIYSPVQYRSDVYLLGYVLGDVEDIGSRNIEYVGDDPVRTYLLRQSSQPHRSAEQLFVFRRTDDGLEVVDRKSEEIITAVVDTQVAIDWSCRKVL